MTADRDFGLAFGDVPVGRVTQSGADFPRCFGAFVVDPNLAGRAPRVARFTELCRDVSRIEDAWDGVSEYPQSPELDALAGFDAEMEAGDWWLVTADGGREPIACPNFWHDGTVIWVWDVSRDAVPPPTP